MESAKSFLSHHEEEGEEFLDKIVTGDETWIPFVNSETKAASKQWMHPHSPNKPKKFKQTLSNRKHMAGNRLLGPQRNPFGRVLATRGHNQLRGLL